MNSNLYKKSSRPEMFCKEGALRNFACLRPATLLKKRLWPRCFPVNLAKFLRTPLLTKHLRWLLENWIAGGLFINTPTRLMHFNGKFIAEIPERFQ